MAFKIMLFEKHGLVFSMNQDFGRLCCAITGFGPRLKIINVTT